MASSPQSGSSRAIVCACEDVSLHDIDEALSAGYRDVESIKRYTGLGTGLCQGRSCLVTAAERVARATQDGPITPFTSRPPAWPTRMADLAGLDPPPHEFSPRPPHDSTPAPPHEPLPEHAEVVIIGGGIMGLGLAYQLAKRGMKDVLVLERGYLLEGASGRNGGGIRAHWSTPINIELGRESLALCASFAQELGINIWFRRGGYLFLARSPETVSKLEDAAKLHSEHGLRTKLIDSKEAAEIVPGMDTNGVLGATFNPDDGVVFPWPFVWGYANGARSLGVRIETFTPVTGIDVEHRHVTRVRTERGNVATKTVVIASGSWSPTVASLAGVKLPNEPHRHEICTCEPLKPFVDPLVADLDTGLYFSQSARGELVGGRGDATEPAGLNHASSLRFLARYSRALLQVMPHLGALKVVRQWAGCYDYTPDRNPILGETPGVGGLLQLSGFVGHGFMMAPAVTRRMADWMGGAQDELFTRFTLQRFIDGRLEPEGMIIG